MAERSIRYVSEQNGKTKTVKESIDAYASINPWFEHGLDSWPRENEVAHQQTGTRHEHANVKESNQNSQQYLTEKKCRFN